MDSLFCASKRKRSGKDRSYDLETGYSVAKDVQEAFKKLKTLEKDITRKEAKAAKGGISNKLVPCKNDRDKLQRQLQDDIPFLGKVLEQNSASQLDRKDKKRHTTGDIREKKGDSYHKHRETGRNSVDYEDEIQGHPTKKQKRNEERRPNEKKEESEHLFPRAAQTEQNIKDALEEKCDRLKKEVHEFEKENAALKNSHKEEIDALRKELSDLNERKSKEYKDEKSTLEHRYQGEIKKLEDDIRMLRERTKEHELVQRQAANTYQNDKDLVKEECEKLKRKLNESKDEKVALDLSFKEEIQGLNEQIKKLQESLEKKSKEGQREINTWINRYNSLENEKKRTEEELKRLQKKSEEGEREIETWKNRNNSLEDEKRRTDEELKRIKALNDQLRIQHENERKNNEDAHFRLEAKNNQLTNQLENERKAKEDALLRLSSMASNKLRDNNPNIADLSDPNRPTKLSEQFSELYDNEWTDAFDELEKLLSDKKDKEIISYLRDFVLEIHSVCSDISSSKMKTIEEAFVKPSVPSENTKIPTEIFKTIKDGIKSMAPKLLEHTRERVLGHLEEKYFRDPVAGCLQHQNVKRYIDKCTEVCWYMSVQDPQLVMDGSKSPDEKFDSNKHREYTKKGPYEEFVVWPALYLYRGGQMLSKGVAQGVKKEIGQQ